MAPRQVSKYHVGVETEAAELSGSALLDEIRETWPKIDDLRYRKEGDDEANLATIYSVRKCILDTTVYSVQKCIFDKWRTIKWRTIKWRTIRCCAII